jgi:hypothetical protein
MSLDEMPSPSAMKRRAAESQLRRYGRIVDVALEREFRGLTLTPPAAGVSIARADAAQSAPIYARRHGDALWMEIHTPPRTKKNNASLQKRTRHDGHVHPIVVPSKAFQKYQGELALAITPLLSTLALPLPNRPYNIAARYYVDRYGRDADLCGLDQGLYDALEHIGVVTDDWYFRTHDGTCVIPAGEHRGARVEFTITPLPDPYE